MEKNRRQLKQSFRRKTFIKSNRIELIEQLWRDGHRRPYQRMASPLFTLPPPGLYHLIRPLIAPSHDSVECHADVRTLSPLKHIPRWLRYLIYRRSEQKQEIDFNTIQVVGVMAISD